MAIIETQVDPILEDGVDSFADIAPIEPSLEAVLKTVKAGEFVAQGGQAQVHRVKKGDVDVAARSVSFQEKDEQIERLKLEARILRGLDHPHIVGYRGYEVNVVERRLGRDIEYTFYMDWIDGPTLRDVLEHGKDHRELSGNEVDAIFAQLGSALSYCHDRGILHRDIKPSNIKLMEGDVVKVIDFGLVKKEGETTMTASKGVFLGTYTYAAPEVREGKRAEAASDWYSAAVTVVELLEGKPYSKVVDPADLREKLGKKKFLPLRLKQSLELLLEEDVTVRTKNVERVKGLYGLGREVDENVVTEGLRERSVDDTVRLNGEKEAVSKWKENFDSKDSSFIVGIYSALISWGGAGIGISLSDNFNWSYAWGGSIAAAFGGGVLGYLVGSYYDSAKAKVKSLFKREKKDSKKEDPLIPFIQHGIPVPETLIAEVNARSLEEKVEESEQPVIANVSVGETPTTEVSDQLNQEVSKKKIWTNFYADVGGVAAGSVGSILMQYFMDSGYSVSQTLVSMVIGGVVGRVAGRLFHKYVQVPQLQEKYGIEEKVGESDSDQALVLYEEEKRGLVERLKERYETWREEKGREWVDNNWNDYTFNETMNSYVKNGISSKGIRRRILPALHHWDSRVQRLALEVIVNNDAEKQEYRKEVEELYPKTDGYPDVQCQVLTYLSNCPQRVDAQDVITKYLLPALNNIARDVRSHAYNLISTLDKDAEIKYRDEFAAARKMALRDRRFEVDADAAIPNTLTSFPK